MKGGFSRSQLNKDILKIELERAKIQAIRGDPETKKTHPDWVTNAQAKNFTGMEKEVTDRIIKHQAKAISRRQKLVGK